MIQHLLFAGIHRQHGRRAAEHIFGEAGGGIATEFIHKEFLNSKKWTPQQHYIVRAVTTGGFWTGHRLREAGYITDGLCPFCGCDDTLFHRLWRCSDPEVSRHRRRIAGDMLTRLADAEEPLWTTGLFPLPHLPLPALTGGLMFFDPDGTEVDYANWQPTSLHAAVDGSCEPHAVAYLTRASWAVVFFDPITGERLHAASGPVWASLPQTSQAAEYSAMAALAQLAERSSLRMHGHSDCRAVVSEVSRCPAQMLRHSAMYAGVLRSTKVAGDMASLATLNWTRAHRSAAVIAGLPQDERNIAMANAQADHLAKEALSSHDAVDPLVGRDLADSIMKARTVLRLACAVLPLFPRIGRLGRSAKTEDADAAPVVEPPVAPPSPPLQIRPHAWNNGQCEKCMIGQVACDSLDCTGIPPVVLHNIVSGLGHLLVRVHVFDDPTPTFVCTRCGGMAKSNHCKHLGRQCTPAHVNQQALNRLFRGFSPATRSASRRVVWRSLPVGDAI